MSDHGRHRRGCALTASESHDQPGTVLVSRRETFNAAHQLRNPRLSDDGNRRMFGKCVNLHGHNYALDVVVAGKIDDASGYVLDLKRLSEVIYQQIIQHVDHRNLNTDVPWLERTHPDGGKSRGDLLGKAPERAS